MHPSRGHASSERELTPQKSGRYGRQNWAKVLNFSWAATVVTSGDISPLGLSEPAGAPAATNPASVGALG